MSEYMKKSEHIYDGKIITVTKDTVLLDNGYTVEREVVHHPGAVAIIPLNKTGAIIFVRQYRHSVKEALLELPAGKLEQHELPLDCAKRELAEEIGLTGRFTKIAEFYTAPGFASEIIHLFLADDLTSAHACKDEDEILSVETHTLQDAVSMISIGSIKDAKTIIGVLMLQSGLALRQELPSQAKIYGVNNETTD